MSNSIWFQKEYLYLLASWTLRKMAINKVIMAIKNKLEVWDKKDK